jgi:nucleotide-binding universal stress UspA family protein
MQPESTDIGLRQVKCMFKKILVPTDGSALSEKAMIGAIRVARECGAKILGISVAQPYLHSPLEIAGSETISAEFIERALAEAKQHLRKIEESARAAGVECETMVAESFDPSAEIVAAANQHECDAIFMGSHGRKGLSRLLLGSETQKVLADSSKPVMVFR